MDIVVKSRSKLRKAGFKKHQWFWLYSKTTIHNVRKATKHDIGVNIDTKDNPDEFLIPENMFGRAIPVDAVAELNLNEWDLLGTQTIETKYGRKR